MKNALKSASFLVFFLALPLRVPAQAAATDIYVSQAGGGSGSSCSSAQSVNFFNSSSNWGSGASQIGPGTTVHLCGTINIPLNGTGLTFQGSGTSGNPITLKWEPGAIMTSPAAANFVSANGKSYLIMDGNGTNPSVTNTANGNQLTNQVDTNGFSMTSCDDCEFKNLTLTNLYVHTAFAADPSSCGNGQCAVAFNVFGNNFSIHDCTMDQQSAGIIVTANNVAISGIHIYGNTISHMNWGIFLNPYNTGGKIWNTFVHDNHFNTMANWDSPIDAYHHDGIFPVHTGTSISDGLVNIQLYNNLFDGKMTNCIKGVNSNADSCATAWIYSNDSLQSEYVFNNIFAGDGAAYLVEAGVPAPNGAFYVYNNTMDCGGGACLNIGDFPTLVFRNNVFTNVGNNPNYIHGTTPDADYDAYLNNPGTPTPFFSEAHAVNVSNLQLDSAYRPLAGSPVIGKGSNLTSLNMSTLDTDKAGVIRPASGAWDIGAYQFGSSSGITSPCDVNGDGLVNVADVQAEINMALGKATCTNPSGSCTVTSVQKVINAALGQICVNP